MQKIFILNALFVLALNLSAQPAWIRKADYAGGAKRTAAVGFAIPPSGYIACGYDSADFKRTCWRYNPALDQWIQMTSFGNAMGSGLGRNCAVAFVIGNSAWVGTGQGGAPYLKDFQEFNAPINTWFAKAPLTSSGRRGAVAFSINGKGYVGTGQDSLGMKSDFWEYDPATNTWTQKASLTGGARRLAVGFAINGKGYIGTGDANAFRNDLWEYDPGTNTWVQKSNFPGTPRYGAAVFVINNKAYIGSGYDNTLQNKRDFWEYDPLSNFWAQKASFFGTERANAAAFAIGNKGYFGTGFDSVPTTDFWEFDPTFTGIDEPDYSDVSIKIYPNPASDYAHFSISTAQNIEQAFVSLYDLHGKLVRRLEFSGAEVSLPCSGLPPGTYVYTINDKKDYHLGNGKLILVN
ncbi:MAG: kelch repeat-containing protein [Bacteroidota bacterium]